MISNAIILAAGSGKRAKGFHKAPKAFIKICGEYIIERSIRLLVKEGVANIHIVTGRKHSLWKSLKKKFPFVKFIENPDWDKSDSYQSLKVGMNYVKEDSLVLESDIIYSNNVLYDVIHHRNDNTVAVSDMTNAGDELWVLYNEEDVIKHMTKYIEPQYYWKAKEFIGVSKLSWFDFNRCINNCCNLVKYEDVFTNLNGSLINASKVAHSPDYKWAEIDDYKQYGNALNVYKKIVIEDSNFNKYLDRNKKVLLNPGPASTTRGVKNSSLQYDICPREEEFGEVVEEVREGLVKIVYDPKWPRKKGHMPKYECCLFTSSGTGAVEAAIVSNAPKRNKINLIFSNDSYGKRIIEIHESHGIKYHATDNLAGFLLRLSNGLIKYENVIWVDHETSTGNINHTPHMAALCKQYQPKANVIVDAMSSFAIKDIDMRWGIDFLISSSNKGIGGLPGVSFVICNKSKVKESKGNFYFSIYENLKHLNSNSGQTLFTPAVFTMYALRQAVREHLIDGSRKERVEENYESLENIIKTLGMEIVDVNCPSKILMSIKVPEWMNFSEYRKYLKDHSITVYPGKDPSYFRLATMGEITDRDLAKLLKLTNEYKKKK